MRISDWSSDVCSSDLHHGHALFPFVQKGWKVFAFEPDDGNRALLEKRLEQNGAAQSLVRLDKRAVSDRVSAGLAFYRSDQSSGISGLSAFHPSHVSKQTVDTTTPRSEEHTSELQ